MHGDGQPAAVHGPRPVRRLRAGEAPGLGLVHPLVVHGATLTVRLPPAQGRRVTDVM